MKTYYLIPLLFLSACSTATKLTLRPQQPPAEISAIRYPEIVNAYHVGRYSDPNDDLVLHEQGLMYWQSHRVHDVLKGFSQLLVCFSIQLAYE